MLIALLIAISLGVWFQSFRIFEREPRAQQIAMQVVSVVKLTRAALLYSDPAVIAESREIQADFDAIDTTLGHIEAEERATALHPDDPAGT